MEVTVCMYAQEMLYDLNYPNSDVHVGHSLECVSCELCLRHWRVCSTSLFG